MALKTLPALRIRGLAGLAAQFRNTDRYVESQMRAVTRQAGDAVVFWASALSPRDTLFMSQHVDVEFTNNGLAFAAGWWPEDFEQAGLRFYPVYQEFGTRYHRAQPSLGPAYRLVVPDYKDAATRVLQRAIARLATQDGV